MACRRAHVPARCNPAVQSAILGSRALLSQGTHAPVVVFPKARAGAAWRATSMAVDGFCPKFRPATNYPSTTL